MRLSVQLPFESYYLGATPPQIRMNTGFLLTFCTFPEQLMFNEWYAKDMSRKMRSTLRLKSKQGYAIGTPPMGYTHDPEDPKHWIVDEEGAAVVRRIYAMRLNGTSITNIAQLLKRDKVLIPSVYAVRKGLRKTAPQHLRGEYLWDTSMVRKILMNPLYVGDVVNFRTYSKSYKLKTRYDNPAENWEISRNVHEPVIPRDQWETVQKTFGGTKMRAPKHTEKSIFAGLLKCSDCGANLNYKYTHDNPDNQYFSCRNKRAGNGLCGKTHHIRVDVLNQLVLQNLREMISFARLYEDEFVKIVVDEHYRQVQLQQRRNQLEYQAALSRDKELDLLYEKLYEEKILGNLTEERFRKLSEKYEDEQAELGQKLKHLRQVVEEDQEHELNADGFLQLVRRYTAPTELTGELLRAFIDKIVVYHKEQIQGETVQRVDIYYKMIGHVELPHMTKNEKDAYLEAFGRKNGKSA